jgi:adenylate cyclase class 2
MAYEVEQKFPVADLAAVERRLTQLGATWEPPVVEIDTYFAHPARDFARTDEALRIRQIGPENRITYKGPKIDSTTKTRREIELPLAAGELQAARFGELLEALGFRRVATVEKTRRYANVEWQGRQVVASLDDLRGVGQFVELEVAAESDEIDAAKAAVADLARHLELEGSERRSYLELLLGQ